MADHDRPLGDRGRRDAPAAGRWLREHVGDVDAVVVSSAERTRQTWALADAELAYRGDVVVEPRVYEATWGGLLAVVRDTPPEVRRLLLVGHNPGCEDLAIALAGSADPAAAERMAAKFPTCGVAVLTFTGEWSGLAAGAARLDAFAVPRG